MLGSFVAIPLGQVVAGPVAAAAGLRATLVGGGVLVLLATAAALLSASVRRLPNTAVARVTHAGTPVQPSDG